MTRKQQEQQDWQDIFDEFLKESKRGAVMISAAQLDDQLRFLICNYLREDKITDELVGNDDIHFAPLSSFGARIKTAFCLGLIGRSVYNDLKIIGKIRNRLAHQTYCYTFEEEEIISWCEGLETTKHFLKQMPPGYSKDHYEKFLFAVSQILYGFEQKKLFMEDIRKVAPRESKL